MHPGRAPKTLRLFLLALSFVAMAAASGCGPLPVKYFKPQAASGKLFPMLHGDGSDFEPDHAYQLAAGGAKVGLEMDPRPDGNVLFVRVYVPPGSTAAFSGDAVQLAINGVDSRMKLPAFVSDQPRRRDVPPVAVSMGMNMSATAAGESGKAAAATWLMELRIPGPDAAVYDLQLPELTVDNVAYPLPVVKFTATSGWGWFTAM